MLGGPRNTDISRASDTNFTLGERRDDETVRQAAAATSLGTECLSTFGRRRDTKASRLLFMIAAQLAAHCFVGRSARSSMAARRVSVVSVSVVSVSVVSVSISDQRFRSDGGANGRDGRRRCFPLW